MKTFPVIKSLFPLLLLGFLLAYRTWTLDVNESYRFQDQHSNRSNIRPDFSFTEVGELLGVNHQNKIINLDRAGLFLMGAGAYVADVNNDGYMDVYFNSSIPNKTNKLYINSMGKNFVDKTRDYGLSSEFDHQISSGAGFFDYNNDGYVDLLLLKLGCLRLFKNIRGTKFVSVENDLGLAKACIHSSNVVFFDYNFDGFLDIYVTNIQKVNDFLTQSERDESHRLIGAKNLFFVNNQGKSFTEISAKVGLDDPGMGQATGLLYLNNDLIPDIVIANELNQNRFFLSNASGTYTERSDSLVGKQYFTGNMGVETADINLDGKMDIFVSNVSNGEHLSHAANFFYLSTKEGGLSEQGANRKVDKCGFAWGAKFLDVDRDKDFDLFVTNGFFDQGEKDWFFNFSSYFSLPRFLRYNVSAIPETKGYNIGKNDRKCFFLNNDGQFTDVALDVGIKEPHVGRGVAKADLDNDGDLDLIIGVQSGRPLVYRNELNSSNRWIGFHLVTKENRTAVGAKVYVETNQSKIYQELFPNNGYGSQSDPRIFFGLGSDELQSAKIIWPGGKEQIVQKPFINQYNTVLEAVTHVTK